MKKFFILMCIFMVGYVSSYSQYYIRYTSDMELLANGVNAGDPQYVYANCILLNDIIDTAVTLMIGNDTHHFQGNFHGNGFKISVDIVDTAANIGLFSEISGGSVFNLIIDGSVTGLSGSQNVGGLAGIITGVPFIYLDVLNCTNLAIVEGWGPSSSVGGIVGRADGSIVFTNCTNNGHIMGGNSVGGIVGTTLHSNYQPSFNLLVLRDCKNSGLILGIEDVDQSYMGGIVGYSSDNNLMYACVNIGQILGVNSSYVGGIVAYIDNGSEVYSSSNSGIVDGGSIAVGGISGYVGDDVIVKGCISTNWVDRGASLYFGSIVGDNNGIVDSCYYDSQMSILGGINNVDVLGSAEGRSTQLMISYNLFPLLPQIHGAWEFTNNLYPRPYSSNLILEHPVVLLSAAPIYLQNNERVNNVITNFFVANYESWGPPPFIAQIDSPYYFQWGSYDDNFVPYLHRQHSVIGYINVPFPSPFPPTNTATINPTGGILQQDTLVVRLDYDWLYFSNYNGFYSINYYIIFEKLVPIRVRRP